MKISADPPRHPFACAAFTLPELGALAATLALLGGLHVPSVTSHRVQAQRAVCINNLRDLSRAWTAFADDAGGLLAGNLDAGSLSTTNSTWAAGWLDFSGRPDNTNWAALMQSQLGPYVASKDSYHCPADRSLSRGSIGEPRVRSYSMNGYLGRPVRGWTSGYRVYQKLSDLTDPAPGRHFVFTGEREDSINDACFFVDMTGYAPPDPAAYGMVDYPAAYHNRAGNLAFADGHAETWRWQDPRTTPLHRLGQMLPLNIASPNNLDIARIQAAASRLVLP
jgi:prepilin-type processing-associated H-X9-DG protein